MLHHGVLQFKVTEIQKLRNWWISKSESQYACKSSKD